MERQKIILQMEGPTATVVDLPREAQLPPSKFVSSRSYTAQTPVLKGRSHGIEFGDFAPNSARGSHSNFGERKEFVHHGSITDTSKSNQTS